MKKDHELTFNRFISIISRCSQVYFDRELNPIKIGSGQIRILRVLGIEDGISQEQIRLLFHLDKGTVAKAIKPLIREGYVRREINPEDKRAYRIFLTEKARDIMPALVQTISSWTDILTSGFTPEEKKSIEDLLSRMSENARSHLFGRRPSRRK